ncbi:MAG: D-2-hydroxyacid dehydrogenase [Verrucomicrobiae bacterium]|nr:D-2-hydroxyacid dehydrogenase [Verrucomicrobiae bacterium]NNJ42708.1 D-2-hydroxyacid dehydrogenase [Akkermansiaceae bacterium]
MHRLTFLDASTLGDIDLNPLADLGKLNIHAVTSPEETAARLQDATIAITNKVMIDAEVISATKNLKLICIAATGTNCVDLEAAKSAGIPVCHVAGYSTAGVTQHTIGLLINLATGMHRYAAETSEWPGSPIFTRLDHPIVDLAGKTLGIVGLGTIGRSVATAASALGMHIIALAREGSSKTEIPRVSQNTFFAQADAVTLHCPLTPETQNLINRYTLGLMKPSSFLINTGRGDLVNEQDLAQALKSQTIAGAALDVLTQEPPRADHVLLADDIPNLIITPHTAWASIESRQRLLQGIVDNIHNFQHGDLSNRVV